MGVRNRTPPVPGCRTNNSDGSFVFGFDGSFMFSTPPPPLARDDGWALPKLKAAGSGQPWPAASRRRSTRPPAPRPCPEKGKKKCMISKRLDRARSRTVNLLLAPLNPPLRREGGEESRRAAARRDLLHEPEADALSIRPHGRRIDATLPLPAELGGGAASRAGRRYTRGLAHPVTDVTFFPWKAGAPLLRSGEAVAGRPRPRSYIKYK